MEIIGADYHRNGVAGEGFFVGIVKDDDGSRKLVVSFPDDPEEGGQGGIYTAVLDLDAAHAGNIYMHPDIDTPNSGGNAWRGDNYHHLQGEFKRIVNEKFERQMAQWAAVERESKGD